MRKIDSLLEEYAESHQTTFNKRVHYVCVPAIFLSLIGLLASIPTGGFLVDQTPTWMEPFLHFGTVVILLGLLYYLRLSFVLFIGMLIFSALVLYGIHLIEYSQIAPLWLVMVVIFVIAWIMQFVGHNHEGKKPSFLKDVQFLMIGPAWTMSHLFDALGLKF
ncbi:putative membrane protein YGL010W [Winogradskyella wandonensis]|uniref:Putative membrane protein YGL010W n=1 Tax=Winogradskyella wandonensis TaxID=1442586 RepID=A0A4R1KS60_9FLAO|nr:Mpo1-like protein [Winogradskyella wandonensis]TCK67430.1 putative membrane protein YGL010W [Winogradskyella wandonensis]